jgi:hypothetical protein
MPRYKASAPIWLKADDHVGPKRFEPGETFVYSGVPPIPAIPLDAEARTAKRKTLPDFWPANASPTETRRMGLGLGASHNANVGELRQTITKFIEQNPLLEKAQ